jgi:hypothetical protein
MKTKRFAFAMLLSLLACDSDHVPEQRDGLAPCSTSSDTSAGVESETVAVTGTEDTAGALGCCYCDQWGATECVDGVVAGDECKAYAAKTGAPAQWCEDWCVLECDQPAAWCCSCDSQCELTTAGEAACVAVSGNVWCEPDPFGGISGCTAQCG